jgi:hypothetical protein
MQNWSADSLISAPAPAPAPTAAIADSNAADEDDDSYDYDQDGVSSGMPPSQPKEISGVTNAKRMPPSQSKEISGVTNAERMPPPQIKEISGVTNAKPPPQIKEVCGVTNFKHQEKATHPPETAGFERTYLMSDGSSHAKILHDSGCSHHCIDSDSELYSLLVETKPAKGHYLCGGGGEVKATHTGLLSLEGYPGGKMKVKVTAGMGRDVFSATQAACDGFGFRLSRARKSGALNAYMESEGGSKFALYEESFGGLLNLF